jgi:hypothetical protein
MTKPKAVKRTVENDMALVPRENVEQLIARAIDKNSTVETMEKLLSMRRELKAEWAREEYHKSLAAFQRACPVIKKDKIVRNRDGTERFRYAPIESIVNQTKDLIEEHGFNYKTDSPKIEQAGFVSAICIITHKAGHAETSSFGVPIDKDAFMNEPQRFASALTFAKRYAFCNGFGILTGDEDDNAEKATAPPAKHSRFREYEAEPLPAKKAKGKVVTSETAESDVSGLLELSKWIAENKIPEGFVLAMLKERKLVAPNLAKLANAPAGVIRRVLSSKDRLLKAFKASDAGASDSDAAEIASGNGKQERGPFDDPKAKTATVPEGWAMRKTIDGSDAHQTLADAQVGEWRGVAIHFGKKKGAQLGKMSAKDLTWWIDNYVPEKYKGRWNNDDLILDAALVTAHEELAATAMKGGQ